MSALEILYRDDHLVAVNKPPGLMVHRSPLSRSETEFALQRLRDQIGQRVHPAHRLDRPTSGVLVFALTEGSARALGEAFQAHEVRKTYVAIVRGWPPESGRIDRPLKVLDQLDGAPRKTREAVTDFRRLATVVVEEAVDRFPTTRYGLLALHPHHGRRHQLRRHLNALGHPIIGDVRYGKGVHNRYFRGRFGVERLLLHCAEMVVPHPVTGEPLTLRAPLDEGYRKIAEALGMPSLGRALGWGGYSPS